MLRSGGLVAFPTETVYGLGADALSRPAVERVFAVKGRPRSDPLIVHVGGMADLALVAESVPAVATALAEAFWPGPLTLVVPRGRRVPPLVTAGLDSVAVRAPSHPVARALIAALGRPVAAPSANRFGRVSPTSAAHVMADLGSTVDLILDGGPCPVGVESTVVDCTATPPRVLRPGGVPLEAMAAWSVVAGVDAPELRTAGPARGMPGPSSGTVRGLPSPGLLPRHYAPRARLVLVAAASKPAAPADEVEGGHVTGRHTDGGVPGAPGTGDPSAGPERSERLRVPELGGVAAVLSLAAELLTRRGLTVGLLVADEDLGDTRRAATAAVVRSLGPLAETGEVARRLYAELRAVDEIGADVILARDFGSTGLAAAVRDRLTRAAEGRVVRVEPGSEAAAAERVVALATGGAGRSPSR